MKAFTSCPEAPDKPKDEQPMSHTAWINSLKCGTVFSVYPPGGIIYMKLKDNKVAALTVTPGVTYESVDFLNNTRKFPPVTYPDAYLVTGNSKS